MRVHRRYTPARNTVLYQGDCFDLLKSLPESEVSLTFTSPPYCMGKEYEGSNRVEDFIEAHERILPEIVRVTAPGGSVCWQVGYHAKNGRLVPLDFLVHGIMQSFPEMILRNRIIWHYGHGLHCSNRFSGRHEVILWYTKTVDHTFNLDAIRVPQKYPGKRHYKGPKAGSFSGNPFGKNPSDVWEFPNVKANHIEKTEHPCQFPVALALRLIRALTNPGELVLDPFMGSGTTGVGAIYEGRRFVGAEILKKYYELAKRRCVDALNGEAKFRQPNIALYKPNQRDAVAQMPKEFSLAIENRNKEAEWQKMQNVAAAS